MHTLAMIVTHGYHVAVYRDHAAQHLLRFPTSLMLGLVVFESLNPPHSHPEAEHDASSSTPKPQALVI